MASPKCVLNLQEVVGRACPSHDEVHHGGEADELRSGIESLIEGTDITLPQESSPSGEDVRVVLVSDLKDLLDKVDARDSLAYLETRRSRKR